MNYSFSKDILNLNWHTFTLFKQVSNKHFVFVIIVVFVYIQRDPEVYVWQDQKFDPLAGTMYQQPSVPAQWGQPMHYEGGQKVPTQWGQHSGYHEQPANTQGVHPMVVQPIHHSRSRRVPISWGPSVTLGILSLLLGMGCIFCNIVTLCYYRYAGPSIAGEGVWSGLLVRTGFLVCFFNIISCIYIQVFLLYVVIYKFKYLKVW